MHRIALSDPQDTRLSAYWALPQRKAGGAAADGWFVAEGRLVVERLLCSPYRPASLLIADSKWDWVADQAAPALARRADVADVPIYTLPDQSLNQVVGFQFHSGIMGCGHRQTPPALQAKIDAWFLSRSATRTQVGSEGVERNQTLLVLPAMNSAENLGSIIRSAQGLGAAGLILGPQSADPLARRVIRVSMGHALGFPCHRSSDWLADLQRLRAVGFRLIGIEHHARMVPLRGVSPGPRQVLVFGNEFAGLPDEVLDQMDEVVGIPMTAGVDSLNVAVTAAIALHHFAG